LLGTNEGKKESKMKDRKKEKKEKVGMTIE
jgi:hypothetical protein